jgi:putative nucleotidyltransferase with HDIG domain
MIIMIEKSIINKYSKDIVASSTARINTHFATKNFDLIQIYHYAVTGMSEILQQIHSHQQIPVEPLRTTIFPAVKRLADSPSVFTLLSQLQSKDDYTSKHSIAVGILAMNLGKVLKLPVDQIDLLMTAGTLHDVGKMMIPDLILNKPSQLTLDEFEVMKRHTVYGYEMISRTATFTESEAIIALEHHEQVDGNGYPHRKKNSEINYLAKIVNVVDVFHAMSSSRIYHDPMPFYQILVEMNNGVFGHFDPAISLAFIQNMMEQLIGEKVLLSDSRIGIIRMIPMQVPTRPFVEVGSTIVDLNRTPEINILRLLP